MPARTRLIRTVKLYLAFLIVALPGLACAGDMVLRYGQAPSAFRSIYSLPIAIAQREGLFRREGLDFRVIVPLDAGADRMVAELDDGRVDLMHIATPFLVRAAQSGSDVVAIAAEFNDPIYSLVAQPEVRRVAELKGKVVAFADSGGSIAYSMRRLFALHGLSEHDLSVKIIEGTPARLRCLQRGDCAAVPLGQPQDLLARSEGYRILADSTEAVPPYLYTVTATRRLWAEAHRDTVVRYVRALAGAFEIIRDPRKHSVTVQTISEITAVPPSVAEDVLALYARSSRRVLPLRGEIDIKGLAQVIAFMSEAGQLKTPPPEPERFVDLRYLRLAGIQ